MESEPLKRKLSAVDDESDEETQVDDHTANPTTMAKFAAAMMRELNSLPLDKVRYTCACDVRQI